MAPKIDFLYPFDKGFFGKTLMSSSRIKADKTAKAERALDSVSDFTKHFEDMILEKIKLERTPKSDVFGKPEPRSAVFSDIYPGSIS